MSIHADVPDKLVQVAVRALALHPPRDAHQAVDVLYVGRHLEALVRSSQQRYSSVSIVVVFNQFGLKTCRGLPFVYIRKNKKKTCHLSDFQVCFSIQVGCFDVAHTLWFTAVGEGGEHLLILRQLLFIQISHHISL